MEQILKLIELDFFKRLKRLEEDLERNKNHSIFERVLNLSSSSRYRLFLKGSDSLEDVADIVSMLVNCLFDDSCFKVEVFGEGAYKRPYLTWGSDDDPDISIKDLEKLVSFLEERDKIIFKNSLKHLDNFEVFKEVMNLEEKFNKSILALASEKVKEEFNKK